MGIGWKFNEGTRPMSLVFNVPNFSKHEIRKCRFPLVREGTPFDTRAWVRVEGDRLSRKEYGSAHSGDWVSREVSRPKKRKKR